MRRDYEQLCGLARSLDVIGERWTLLIVRELLIGPRRFTDLLEGLPGVPPSLLSARLKELQRAGIISKRVLAPPAASTVYDLTEAGTALEGILYALGRWGVRYGRKPRQSDAARPEWLLFALRSVFRPEASAGVHATCELRLPEATLHATVEDGVLTTGTGSGPSPQLVLTGDRPTVIAVLMGRLTTRDAVRGGALKMHGERKVLERFLNMFRLEEAGRGGRDTRGGQGSLRLPGHEATARGAGAGAK